MHPLHQFKYCPECGSARFVEHNGKSKHCEACGFTYYFNPSAATVALIEREVPQSSNREMVQSSNREIVQSSNREIIQSSNREMVQSSNREIEWCVVRRAKNPAKGTLDLPGGFSDMFETSEEGVCREVKEETGLDVERVEFLFSLPNQYEYSGFLVHTIDFFYRCHVRSTEGARAADDAGELMWLRPEDVHPEDFGLLSVRKGVEKLLAAYKTQV